MVVRTAAMGSPSPPPMGSPSPPFVQQQMQMQMQHMHMQHMAAMQQQAQAQSPQPQQHWPQQAATPSTPAPPSRPEGSTDAEVTVALLPAFDRTTHAMRSHQDRLTLARHSAQVDEAIGSAAPTPLQTSDGAPPRDSASPDWPFASPTFAMEYSAQRQQMYMTPTPHRGTPTTKRIPPSLSSQTGVCWQATAR